MTLSLTDPAAVFYSQRVDGRPFVNCLPYSICPVLRWMGYDVPKDYGMQIRKASGVPVAEGRGTSHSDMARALGRLLPDAPIVIQNVDDAELVALVPQRKAPDRRRVVSIIARMERLPTHYRRHVGYGWEGLHALTLYQRKRNPDGSWSFYMSDPMGRTWRGYAGEWISQSQLTPALKRNSLGLVRVVHGKYGTAV